uniref:hypothetical protein n=1 Tax=Methanobrevibacter cuticularis TaxID=47311 RepID=UPI001FE03BBC|nr:hypothetical protein [Methanobrevibacter cuticularis]
MILTSLFKNLANSLMLFGCWFLIKSSISSLTSVNVNLLVTLVTDCSFSSSGLSL